VGRRDGRDGPSGVYADYLHQRDPSGPTSGVVSISHFPHLQFMLPHFLCLPMCVCVYVCMSCCSNWNECLFQYVPSHGRSRPEHRADVSVSPFRGVSAPIGVHEVGHGRGRWSDDDGGGMLPPSELEKRDRAREYLAELDQQVSAKKIQKEKERREKDEYERKVFEEAMAYDPFGRPGCGAPSKDHLQSSPTVMGDSPRRVCTLHYSARL
jgi:hypothetical protein